MAKFDKALQKVLKLEGGFVNNPNDKGGATNSGITISVYRSYFGHERTVEDLKTITYFETAYIYRFGYWDKIKGDEIKSQSVAELLFDFAVNSGVYTAVRKIQKIVGAVQDGTFGQQTLNAVNDYNPNDLFDKLKQVRQEYYDSIVTLNPSQKIFHKGWSNRLK